MALESVTNIADLVITNPTATDPKSEGDDHIRNIKKALKTDLPNITGPITATQAELNVLDGITASTAELNLLDGVTATTAEINHIDGVTSPIQTQLDGKQPLDADLTAIAGLSAAGMVARTGAGAASVRTLTAGAGITITNGDGVSGNPTIAVNATDLPNSAAVVSYTPAGTGAVATTVQAKNRQVVHVTDFSGVDPTGATDSLAGLQSASNYCKTSGYKLMGVPGTYVVSGTWVIECDADLSTMLIQANGTTVSVAVQVGPNTSGQYLFDADIKLPFVINTAKTVAGWSGFDSSIGVLAANVYQSRITVPSVYNFGVGLKVGGYGVGNVYNTYNIGVLFGNKINLQCKAGDTNGWSNQNTYIGGRYGYSSGEGSAVSGTAQIQLRDFDESGSNAPNTNVWINPSVEGNEPEFHFDIQGSYNTIISPRLELTGGVFARVNFHAVSANETVANTFIGGYKAGITYTFSGAGTSANNNYIGSRGSDTFDFSGSGYNVRSTSGNTVSAPHFQGFPSTVQPLPKDQTATDWTYRIFGEGFAVKTTASTQPRIQVDASGYVFFGTGSAALAGGIRYNTTPAAITSNIAFAPDSDNNLTLGTTNRRWSYVHASNVRTHAVTVATLPAAATAGAGTRAFVTDANATTFASIVAGGGANGVPVYSDGTNWRIG